MTSAYYRSLELRGATLVEMIITVALIGVISAIATLAFPRDRTPQPNDPLLQVARARTLAVENSRRVSVSLTIDGRPVDVLALPDGSVIADSILHVDWMSGRP